MQKQSGDYVQLFYDEVEAAKVPKLNELDQ